MGYRAFDITAVLQGIRKKPHSVQTREELCVTLVPGGKPAAGAGAMVASIELVRQ